MSETTENGGTMESAGEAVGGVLSGIPSAVGDFFAGLGNGAGVHGTLDWAALVVSIALFLSVIQGVRKGRIVGPFIRGAIAVALMGWAVA